MIILFAVSQLILGLLFLLRSEDIIHIFFVPFRGFQRFDKLIPTRIIEFLRLSEHDPQSLSTNFPIGISVIKLMGMVAIVISMMTFCGVFANSS